MTEVSMPYILKYMQDNEEVVAFMNWYGVDTPRRGFGNGSEFIPYTWKWMLNNTPEGWIFKQSKVKDPNDWRYCPCASCVQQRTFRKVS